MKSKKEVLQCDMCDKWVESDEDMYIGGHPFQGWYHLNQHGGSTQLQELRKKRDWDFCSLQCISDFCADGGKSNTDPQVGKSMKTDMDELNEFLLKAANIKGVGIRRKILEIEKFIKYLKTKNGKKTD